MIITRTGSPIGLIIIGSIFMIVGALMMYTHVKHTRFVATPGIIQNSDLQAAYRTSPGAKTGSYQWYLCVNYSYEVDGQAYNNDEISSAPPNSDASNEKPPSDKMVAYRNMFIPGEKVTVYVSPRNPNKSFLLHTNNYGIWVILLGIIFLALAGFWARQRSGI